MRKSPVLGKKKWEPIVLRRIKEEYFAKGEDKMQALEKIKRKTTSALRRMEW